PDPPAELAELPLEHQEVGVVPLEATGLQLFDELAQPVLLDPQLADGLEELLLALGLDGHVDLKRRRGLAPVGGGGGKGKDRAGGEDANRDRSKAHGGNLVGCGGSRRRIEADRYHRDITTPAASQVSGRMRRPCPQMRRVVVWRREFRPQMTQMDAD